MIGIEKMGPDEFKVYLKKLVENYAVENVKSGRWEKENALEKSKREVRSLLNDGLNTKNHELLSLLEKDTGKKIGHLWLHIFPGMEKKGFIYDFVVDEKFRGKGYGKESLKALEEYASKMGVEELSLHVFAHNTVAVALYKKMGYEITSMNMAKHIGGK